MTQRLVKKISLSILPLLIGLFLLFSGNVAAHENDADAGHDHMAEYAEQLVEAVHTNSIRFAIASGIILGILTIISLLGRGMSEKFKKIIFVLMVIAITTPTVYFVLTTLHINFISQTKGPIHWHADFRIFACGDELRLQESQGLLSNKIGTQIFHHHNDQRIHVEGVVINTTNFELGNFFRTVGANLTQEHFEIPTQDGFVDLSNGDTCPNGQEGVWQAFVYKTEADNPTLVRQIKLDQYTNYLPSPEITIPPGDCIIFEFSEKKERTEHLCTFYQIAKDKGELTILEP